MSIATGLEVVEAHLRRRFREDMCLEAASALEVRLGIITPIEPR